MSAGAWNDKREKNLAFVAIQNQKITTGIVYNKGFIIKDFSIVPTRIGAWKSEKLMDTYVD
jgi:hypothetical protein